MIKISTAKGCKGCNLNGYENGHDLCDVVRTNSNVEKCPCQKCLIKMVCEKPCDIFIANMRPDLYKRLLSS